MTKAGRVALIHALEESIPPIRLAFREFWPDVETFDLFDSSLAIDRARGASDDELFPRFARLLHHAQQDAMFGRETIGVLFTCSAFGQIIERLRVSASIPIFKPNEAAFDEALGLGQRIGILVTFPPSAETLSRELVTSAKIRQHPLEVHTTVVEDALAALKQGDTSSHDEMVARATERLRHDVDVIILGQFSMARARSKSAEVCGLPVLSTPLSAVKAMRRLIEGVSGD